MKDNLRTSMGYHCLYNKVDFMIDMGIICYGLLYMTNMNEEKLLIERMIKKYMNINDFKEKF